MWEPSLEYEELATGYTQLVGQLSCYPLLPTSPDPPVGPHTYPRTMVLDSF